MFKDDKIITIPNLLSACRLLLLIPFFIAISAGDRLMACLWAGLGILSDLLDGFLARKLNQCSNLGRVMDPFIDKLTVLSVGFFLVISDQYTLPLWFFLCLLLREAYIVTGSALIIKRHRQILESKKPGKISSFLVGITIFLFVLKWQPIAMYVMYLAFLFTIYSTWTYSLRFIAIWKQEHQE